MEKYCTIIVTPDSVRRNLENVIIHEIIERTGAQLVWKKYLKIDKEAVRLLYPKKVAKSYYPSMVENITSGESLILVLKGRKGIATEVKQLKGKFYVEIDGRLEVDGLRLKYGAQIVKKSDFEENEKTKEIYEFRLHTNDNLEEAAMICALFMDDQEVTKLRCSAPTLYSEIQKTIKLYQIIRRQT